jgi:predicted RNase H-like nuclease
MKTVVGIDGAPGGWLAVMWGVDVRFQLFKSIRDVLDIATDVIAIDMPIGLPRLSGRAAEQAARQLLKRRSSCVFTVPARTTIEARDATFAQACAINEENSTPKRKFSKQSFGIFGKIRELDIVMTPAMQGRVHEVHPEISFAMMNDGTALETRKKDEAGRKQRTKLLLQSGFPWHRMPENQYPRKDLGRDDLIDACACAWSARRILEGKAMTLPQETETDAKSLVMSITA